METINVLMKAGVPRELAGRTAGYFAPADRWEIHGVSADRLSVYLALSDARTRGQKPGNYVVEVLMDPCGDRDKYPDPLPPPP